MKKLLVTLIAMAALVALLTLPAQAQVKIVKGVKAGLNLAKFYGDDSEGIQRDTIGLPLGTRTGFVAGAFARFEVTPNFSVQPEALFAMKGSKADTTMFDVNLTSSLKLDYLEIPILLRGAIPTQAKMTPFLCAGPVIGFNLSSKFKAEGDSAGVPGAAEFDVDNATTVDFGLAFGGGVEFQANGVMFGVEGRYTLGLSNAYEDPTEGIVLINDEGKAFDLKNSAISILAFAGF